ncbi:unnamed protein product [Auanema sp. JU1783]|nr:unnamed protein product [Auanema sp. JU1783]
MSKEIEYWLKKGGKENVTEDDFEPAQGSRGRTTTKTSASRTRSTTRSSGASTGASSGRTRSGTMTGGNGTTMTATSGSFRKIQKLLDNCEGNGDLYAECGCFPYFMVFLSLAIAGTLAALTVAIDFKRLPI